MQAIKYGRSSDKFRRQVENKNFLYFAPQSGGFKRTVILFMIMLFAINFVLIDCRSLKTHQRQMMHRFRRTAIRGCGGQVVDFLNYLCDARVYEPRKCLIFQRYFCNPRNSWGCNFNCGRSDKKRSTDETSSHEPQLDDPDISDFVQRLNKTYFAVRPATAGTSRRKVKRQLHNQCCLQECSREYLKRYCLPEYIPS